jgi:hypothetical protein
MLHWIYARYWSQCHISFKFLCLNIYKILRFYFLWSRASKKLFFLTTIPTFHWEAEIRFSLFQFFVCCWKQYWESFLTPFHSHNKTTQKQSGAIILYEPCILLHKAYVFHNFNKLTNSFLQLIIEFMCINTISVGKINFCSFKV